MSISLKLEDMETFDLIAQICGRHQVYPPNPDPEWTGGIEDFFRNLLSEYKGPLDKKVLPTIWMNTWLRLLLLMETAHVGFRLGCGPFIKTDQ